jgi:hypothetical protein
VYCHSDFFGLHVPESSTGAFDLYGWQLLWMIGLALGSIYAQTDPLPAFLRQDKRRWAGRVEQSHICETGVA